MKILTKTILAILLLIITPSLVSALDLTTYWQENNQNIISIENGEPATIYILTENIQTATSLYIDISLDNNGIYSNIVDPSGSTYQTIYTVTSEDYNNQEGEYGLTIQVAEYYGGEWYIETEYLTLNVLEQSPNQAPNAPSNPIPINGAINIPLDTNLQWTGSDPDGDQLTYSLYLNNQLFYQGTNNNYDPNLEYETTYSWYVIADDGELQTTGPIWTFTTVAESFINTPPVSTITSPIGNQVIDVGTSLEFSGIGTDEDEGDIIIGYLWNIFKDQNMIYSTSAQTFTYDFDQEGTFVVNFLVRDNNGAWSQPDSVNVMVNEGSQSNTPPVLNILYPTEDETIEGIYNIVWLATDEDQNNNLLNIKIEYIKTINIFFFKIPDPLETWIILEDLQDNNDGIYSNWNTNLIIDNGNYRLRITVTDDYEDPAIVSQEVDFIVNNIQPEENNAPQVLSLNHNTNSGTITFTVSTYDQDGNDVISLDFQIYYNNAWHTLSCIEELQNQWVCTFDSTVVNYDNNVIAKARAYDGEDWGYFYQTDSFTIDNTEQGEQSGELTEIQDKHKFSIKNVIPKVYSNKIDLYVNVKNKGNVDEDVSIKATVIQTGLTVYNNVDLDTYDSQWMTIQLPKLNSGVYVVNVQVSNNEFKDNRLVVLNI